MRGFLIPLWLFVAFSAATAQSAGETQPQPLTTEEVQQDLRTLYNNLKEGHFDLYGYRSEADYDAFYEGLLSEAREPMDKAAAAALYQRFAAFGRIGHANTDAPIQEFVAHFRRGGRFVPLFVRRETDGRFVLTRTADLAGSAPAGSELVTIEGEPAARRLTRLTDLVSAERPYMAFSQMERTLPALLWIERRTDDPLLVSLLVDGEVRELAIGAVTWTGFTALQKDYPAAGGETDFDARAMRMMGDGVAYLRPGPFGGLPDEGDASLGQFEGFIDRVFASFINEGATDLIIDLRNNPGGDNSFSDPMIAWFADRSFRFSSNFMLKASAPTKAHYRTFEDSGAKGSTLSRLIAAEEEQPNGSRYPFKIDLIEPRKDSPFEGRVWVLINRHSYSNAASVAAIVQDYGFGTVLGEETADLPSTFASVVHFTLPNSGFSVAYPKSYFVRPSGVESLHGVIANVSLPRQTLMSNTDTMLVAALACVEAAR